MRLSGGRWSRSIWCSSASAPASSASRARFTFLGQLRPGGDAVLGRAAPPHPGGVPHLPDAVAREAYSHEVSSAGFGPAAASSTIRPSIPTPIRSRRGSGRRRSRRRRQVSTRAWASFFCPTRPCARRRIPRPCADGVPGQHLCGGGRRRPLGSGGPLECDFGKPGVPRSLPRESRLSPWGERSAEGRAASPPHRRWKAAERRCAPPSPNLSCGPWLSTGSYRVYTEVWVGPEV